MAADQAFGESYLDLLDGLLAMGAAGFGTEFARRQVAYVASRQRDDGGFPGRDGGSDIYYTDFALRILDLLGPDHPALDGAAEYVAGVPVPTDLVHCYSLLACARILQRRGRPVALDTDAIAAVIARQAIAGGGYGLPNSSQAGATQSFLAALSREMLGEPGAVDCVEAVEALRRDDGGFADTVGEIAGQLNATAAATGLLAMGAALTDEEARGAREFIAGMTVDGRGLRAHAGATDADLLSTFTGLVTLWATDGVELVDAREIARFVGGLARANGGFGGAPGDIGADVEYTYYGVGCLALVRLGIGSREWRTAKPRQRQAARRTVRAANR